MKIGSIAAGHKTTVESAKNILELGGNAFDAAVGAVFTSMVSEFTLTGPGGGGAFLAYPNGSEPILFDFFVDTPPPQPNKDLDFSSILIDFGSVNQEFHIGRGSVAVPGNTAGLLSVHERLGKLPLRAILEPAIDAARKGVTLNESHGYLMEILDPILTYTSAGKKLFTPEGKILREGDNFRNPAFADFLEELIVHGTDFFYKGSGAKCILDVFGEKGLLTSECLANYEVIERTPLKIDFQNKIFYTNPVPSVGGTLITFVLKLIEESQVSFDADVLDFVHAMQVTAVARKETTIDQNDNFRIAEILEESVFNKYLEQYFSQSTPDTPERDLPSSGATTQVSIIDRAGNAASVTTTNGAGCGYLIPEMGIMLNNMLGEEDLNPSGFHNFVKQQRLPTMISPSLVMGDNGPELVLGSGGSNRIRSAILQVMLNYFMNKMSLNEAVKSPRIHMEGDIFHCEPGIKIPASDKLPDGVQIHKWDEQNLFFGGVNAVTPTEAVGDKRRGGTGIVF
ncbi:MAG: gamma-glutamyltransferase [Candidatus Marinimicrobia bacterium]|nr:gamma-glutamyltransferase [Candidatus Neomarinimicrobiota bacterium]